MDEGSDLRLGLWYGESSGAPVSTKRVLLTTD